jgi:hypothetical protein
MHMSYKMQQGVVLLVHSMPHLAVCMLLGHVMRFSVAKHIILNLHIKLVHDTVYRRRTTAYDRVVDLRM